MGIFSSVTLQIRGNSEAQIEPLADFTLLAEKWFAHECEPREPLGKIRREMGHRSVYTYGYVRGSPCASPGFRLLRPRAVFGWTYWAEYEIRPPSCPPLSSVGVLSFQYNSSNSIPARIASKRVSYARAFLPGNVEVEWVG